MSKFYRVLKETPLWEAGAIISDESGEYRPIDDLYVKEVEGLTARWYEGRAAVENQPTWFERVYKVSVLKQAKYLTKEKAREVHAKLYEK